jgi:phosphatidylglycerol---prolipoprotein diacylglyceryl transferase
MIPYFQPPPLKLGPLSLEAFGLLAALGIFLASYLLTRHAARQGLTTQPLSDFAPWAIVGGLLGGHWVHLFLYHPEELSKGPLQVLKVWDGLSSFGGLFGGVIATLLFFRRHRLALRPYADAFALSVAPGWAVARIGCFLAHDHPGSLTDFPLAVAFPAGARHDLGLYDALLLGAITAVLYVLHHRHLLRARLLPLLALLYAPARFAFDFLRARDLAYVDARYLGLTPAQYGCLALLAFAAWGLLHWRPQPSSAQAPPLSPQPHTP